MSLTRPRTSYACSACGHVAARWVGRCGACGAWGTLEERVAPAPGRPAPALVDVPEPLRLADLRDVAPERISTGIDELDRVLGGGLVAGSLVLLGGEPGIGKSTLVMQALARMSADRPVLLVTGEESAGQVASRAARLGEDCGRVAILAETRLETVLAAIRAHRPAVCAIDSVQTLASDAVESVPGTVGQVRAVALELMALAKREGVAMLIVGQVTKDGALAGPRALEHLVDGVVTFEGEEERALRILRASKNRFGSTNETGILEMRRDGLVAVADPASVYLGELDGRVGSCAFPAVAGSRVLVVEIQALVSPTEAVPPRRVAVGVDRTRLTQIVAVLRRHAGLRLGDNDVFVSVAGGVRALDPAADLPIALAITSAHRGVPLAARTAAFGELGLTGALRPAGHAARRIGAVAAHGMDAVLLPSGSATTADEAAASVQRVAGVAEALEAAFVR